MTDDFMAELQSEAASETPARPEATLDSIREMASKAAELEGQIVTLEDTLKSLKQIRYRILNEELPAVMTEARVPDITVDGYKFECRNYYKASIPADDPEEDRERAFAWVEQQGGGDIINNTVTVAFPKEMGEEANEFAQFVRKKFDNRREVEVVQEKKVPWNRLTSWLKDYHETPSRDGSSKAPIPMDLLHATVGRIVKIKDVRD